MPPTQQYFLGIDLHKTVLQICVLDAKGFVVCQERNRIATRAAGLSVVESLARWRPARMAVEAIGLNRWFVNACREAGFDLIVVDAGRLNLRAQGKKTDRRDALEIARHLRLGDLDRHAKTYYPSDEEYGVRQLERVRHDLVGQRTHLSNRLRSLLGFIPDAASGVREVVQGPRKSSVRRAFFHGPPAPTGVSTREAAWSPRMAGSGALCRLALDSVDTKDSTLGKSGLRPPVWSVMREVLSVVSLLSSRAWEGFVKEGSKAAA